MSDTIADAFGPSCSCGSPSRSEFLELTAPRPEIIAAVAPRVQHKLEQVRVPAGSFTMGDSSGDGNACDSETPLQVVALHDCSIDATTVTNADFAKFVQDTAHRTEAEVFGFSAVFHLALRARPTAVMGSAAGTPWWVGIRGAIGGIPVKPRFSLDGLDDHPVVHVSNRCRNSAGSQNAADSSMGNAGSRTVAP